MLEDFLSLCLGKWELGRVNVSSLYVFEVLLVLFFFVYCFFFVCFSLCTSGERGGRAIKYHRSYDIIFIS